jgi:capsule polysaccharide export protein KpsE/RkpR
MSEPLSFSSVLALLRAKWRTLLLIGVLAAAASAIFSGPSFIKPRFRSSAIVYPVNLSSYSQETRSDQLLQMLESNSLRDSLIRIHHLPEHYRIDTTHAPGLFYLHGLYKERVSISKTRYESVQIEIEDEDPRVAQRMVIDLLAQCDTMALRLHREKSREVLVIARGELEDLWKQLHDVEVRLDSLRQQTGLLNYSAQTEEVTRGYMRMLSSGGGGAAGKAEAKALLKALGERGGEFESLSQLAKAYRELYVEKEEAYNRALTDVTKKLTYTNVMVYPEVADKKIFPIRWLIVVAVTASAVFLALLLFGLRGQRH